MPGQTVVLIIERRFAGGCNPFSLHLIFASLTLKMLLIEQEVTNRLQRGEKTIRVIKNLISFVYDPDRSCKSGGEYVSRN
jgi:hypothetical protein